jgi:hypothetical protein
MLRYLTAITLTAGALLNASVPAAAGVWESPVANQRAWNGTPPASSTEADAQKRCPADEVVWLNEVTGRYHEKANRFYAKTPIGGYVCRKEADAAGFTDLDPDKQPNPAGGPSTGASPNPAASPNQK